MAQVLARSIVGVVLLALGAAGGAALAARPDPRRRRRWCRPRRRPSRSGR